MKNIAFLATAFLIASQSNAVAAGFEIFAPHRAVYDVKLREAEDRSGITGMDGRIVYEVQGNACDGLSIKYRFVTNVRTGGELFVTDQQTATYESPDGKEFTFQTKNFVNDQADQTVQGTARVENDATRVKLKSPQEKELKLDKSAFVSTHLLEVIAKARAGETVLEMDIFDGSGDADEVVASTAIIGKERKVEKQLEREGKDAGKALENSPAWPVTISYFKRDVGNSGEALPIYEVSFLMHDNGITRRLLMRYPDYALEADLKQLEMLEPVGCN